MSSITTTPAPAPLSLSKTPYVIGIAVVGLVAVTAVVAPRLSISTTTSSPAVSAAPRAGGPDALEAQQRAALARSRSGGLDVAERAGIQARLQAERSLDRLGKTSGNYAGLAAPAAARVPRSVLLEQIPTLHRAYPFTGTTGYSSLEQAQVPGGRPAYVYKPSSDHMVWNDRFVPPYENPTWAEAIQAHYFGRGTAD